MSKYIAPVDTFARTPTAFLVADDILELIEFSKKLDLPVHHTGIEHIDVVADLYEKAIKLGAVPISSKELVRWASDRLKEMLEARNE
ncbi:hypothetical protein LCGC14_1670490 [marine sediment metagenome]|uniref:DUF4031 domain-containing protein n=1 Tax=marine sediment metagenome TaxID=412755 RepID=A0A0F9K7B1_9ZZZZ